jgi:hypothetical protein
MEGACAAIRLGLQPGQLPSQLALPKPIQGSTLTTLREKFSQDRGRRRCGTPSTSPSSWQKSPCRGAVRGDCQADRPLVPGLCLGPRFAAADKRVRTPSPCVRGASREPVAEAEERGRGLCGGLSLGGSEPRLHGSTCLGKKLATAPSGVRINRVGVVAEARERVSWGRSA